MQILPGATAIVRNAAVLRPGERVVVVADERSRSVADHFVAAASAAGAEVRLVLIPLARSHGTAPPAAEACAIRAADVVLAATSFSLSHTPLRVEVQKRGGRFLSLADYDLAMLQSGGVFADYAAAVNVVNEVAGILTAARSVEVRTEGGTSLRLDVAGREGLAAPAYCANPSDFGSPPDIEANVAPVEDRTEGVLVVDGSIPMPGIGVITEPVHMQIRKGRAIDVQGGAQAAKLLDLWTAANDDAVRVAAELGIGLNRSAKLRGRMLEDEGVYGTVHIGFGANTTIGGRNAAPMHVDMVCRKATVSADGRTILANGELSDL